MPTLDALSTMLESLILNRRNGVSHVEGDSNLVAHLADFLFHILPAIDTNDTQKTYSAFKFYYGTIAPFTESIRGTYSIFSILAGCATRARD